LNVNQPDNRPALTTTLMPPKNPPRTITLFCWILDVSKRSFSVPIEDSRTVDELKTAIVTKKPSAFVNVELDELTLWKPEVCGSL
jgi:hypothetical protein